MKKNFRIGFITLLIATCSLLIGCENPFWPDAKVKNPNGDDVEITYNIGDTGPGGGKIFYYDEDGFVMADTGEVAYYLEAAPENVNAPSTYITWCNCTYPSGGCYSGGVTGLPNVAGNTGTAAPNQAILDTIGQGRRDTALIVAHHTGDNNTNNAAKACDGYTSNGYSDWYLPSIGELYLLYTERSDAGMGSETYYFWSSSQGSSYFAWDVYFSSGLRYDNAKLGNGYVRPVRAF